MPPLRRSYEDRKSTRLNSSHVAISYAVFCLKKKKNKDTYDELCEWCTVEDEQAHSNVAHVIYAALRATCPSAHFSPFVFFFFFFFLMIRRPPRSTLFPYTTALPILHLAKAVAHLSDTCIVSSDNFFSELKRDRKSTRLNSSHVAISYAVFCLKK